MDRYNAAVDPHSTAWCPYRSTGLRVPATYRHQDGACRKAEMPYTTVNNGRPAVRTTLIAFALSLSSFLFTLSSHAAAENSGTAKSGSDQNLTLDDIGRGLKSAAKNIEEEIPKIGPAIGETFKKVTGGGKEKSPPKPSVQNTTKDKQ